MKTQNNNTENKNNQLEKVLLRSAAVIVSFVLISFTVSAQGFWKQLLTNNSFSKVAMLMVEESDANLSAEAVATTVGTNSENYYMETAADKQLDVEEWMTDDAYFGAYNNIFQPEFEKGLEIENWMKDENHFAGQYAVEKDKELKIEPWMTDNAHWKL